MTTIPPSNQNTGDVTHTHGPSSGKVSQTQDNKFRSDMGDSVRHAPDNTRSRRDSGGRIPPSSDGKATFDTHVMHKIDQWGDPDSGAASVLSFVMFLMKMMIEAQQQDRGLRHQSRVNEYDTSMKSVEAQKDAARLQFIAGVTSAATQIVAGSISIGGSIKAGKAQKKYDRQIDNQFKINKPARSAKKNQVQPAGQKAVQKPTEAAQKAQPKEAKTDAERMEKAAADIRNFNAGADYRQAQYSATNEVRTIMQKSEGASMLARSVGEVGSARAKWAADLKKAESDSLNALSKYIGSEGTENDEMYKGWKSSVENARNIFKSISDTRHSAISHASKA